MKIKIEIQFNKRIIIQMKKIYMMLIMMMLMMMRMKIIIIRIFNILKIKKLLKNNYKKVILKNKIYKMKSI